MSKADTHQEIMDVAQELLQSKGFHAFSYADIAQRIGIKKASIHYHFATKNDLGKALIKHYRNVFDNARALIDDRHADALARLEAYAKLYRDALAQDNRMCLCGMLAADFMTLPEDIQQEVSSFMAENAAWLAQTLEDARVRQAIAFDGDAQREAELLLSGLEGGMLIARSMGGVEQLDQIVQQLFQKYL